MAWGSGLEFADGSGNVAYAIHQNTEIMASRGNQVITGGDVTANGTSNLTTTTADIDIADVKVIVNGAWYSLTSITSIDLSEAYDDLIAGQSMYVLIYIKSDGTISDPSDGGSGEGKGTAATTGQQLPPDLPEDTTPLAIITLTFGDTVVNTADIEDYIVYTPDITLLADDNKSYWGDDGDLFLFHNITTYTNQPNQNFIDSTISLNILTDGVFRLSDKGDGDGGASPFAHLFQLDTNARTLTIGASGDTIVSTFWGNIVHMNDYPIITYNSGDANVPQILFDSGDDIRYTQSTNTFSMVIGGGTKFSLTSSIASFPVEVKNLLDNSGFYTGIDGDLRWYHDGTDSLIKNITGELQLWGVSNIVMIDDLDASDARLFDLDLVNRTLDIGAPDGNDNIDTTFNGFIESNTFSSEYDSQTITSSPIVLSASYQSSDEITLITYSSTDYDRMILDHRKIRITVDSSWSIFYTSNDGQVIQIDVRWQYTKDGGSTWVTVDTDTDITTSGSGSKAVSFTTNTVEFDGDTITGDVQVRGQVIISAGSAGTDEADFDGGTPTCETTWAHAFKSV